MVINKIVKFCLYENTRVKASWLKAGTHQADGRPLANVGQTASDGRASLFGVFHSSALVGLTSAAVCPIKHVESASGPSVKGRTLIGCSV